MQVNWDALAEEAEEGLAGFLGKLARLNDEGKLRMVVCGYAYEVEDGKNLAHSYHFEPGNDMWAMGLWELIKHQMLNNQESDPE